MGTRNSDSINAELFPEPGDGYHRKETDGMTNNPKPGSHLIAGRSFVNLFLILTICIFVSETIIMLLINALPPLTRLGAALLDSTLLLVLVSPIFYIFVSRPLTSRSEIDKALKESEEITEQKCIAETLTNERSLFRTIIDLIPDALYVKDLEGRKLLANPKEVQLSGHNFENEIIGKTDFDLHPDIEAKRAQAEDELVFQTGKPMLDINGTLTDSEGELHYLLGSKVAMRDRHGKITGLVGLTRDITERRLAEDELRESKDRYKKLFEEAPLGIALVDSLTGQIDEVNPVFAKIADRTMEEIMYADWMSITHPDDIQKDLDNMALLNAGKTAGYQMEKRYLQKNGSSVWISMTIAPIYVKDRTHPRHLAMIMDITDRKQAEEEIKLKNEELKKHIAEKDKFFSIIAHDLRSPLSSFIGLTQLMLEVLPSTTIKDLQKMVVSMEDSATNIFNLLENLLEWAQMQRGLISLNPVVVQLHSIVKESMLMLEESVRNKKIGITFEIPVDFRVIADTNMLQSIVRNLVSNAVKFTPKGGKITLSAKASENNKIEISIKDSGIGMSPAIVDHLFQLNVQTNRPGTEGEPSSGLGLLLCKEFIEKLGGKIGVESEEGIGSIFRFTLPRSSEPEEKNVAKNLDLPNKEEDKVNREVLPLKILIAEDDENSQMLISLAIKTLSKEILKVRTGFEAVEACRNHPDIDLILMDIQMPQMDGYEATRQIRQFNKEVIIIAQTAYANKGDREKAIEAGCNEYVAKPIKKAELVGMVKKYY